MKGSNPAKSLEYLTAVALLFEGNVKKVPMVEFRGSTQEKWSSEIFRFGYRKASNDKMVPDPVGSGLCRDHRRMM